MKILSLLFLVLSLLSSQEHHNLVVQSINGDEISIKELLTKGPVLVSFWALWCEPCKIEMKQLQSIYDRYKERGFTILAINQDNQKSISKVSAYISSHGYSFTIATDPKGEISQQFNVQSIPLSLLFNKDGALVYKALGYKPGDEKKIEDALEKIFAGKSEE